MPYTMQWHASKNVLIVTYQGKLTLREFRQLHKELAATTSERPEAIVRCSDMREFDAFPDADDLRDSEKTLHNAHVRGSVIILTPENYRQLSRAIVGDFAAQLPLYFVSSMDDALMAADQLLA